jgi:hypothetical protein
MVSRINDMGMGKEPRSRISSMFGPGHSSSNAAGDNREFGRSLRGGMRRTCRSAWAGLDAGEVA